MIVKQTTTLIFEYPQDYLQEQEWCKTKGDKWIHRGTDTLGAVYENQISYSIGASAKVQTEPQTDTHDIRTETHKCVKDTHDKVETMSCQECKWWFTDSLKHGGYCQSLLYNHECRYEPEVDCSWK